jgi:acyl-CoA dehydrogenase
MFEYAKTRKKRWLSMIKSFMRFLKAKKILPKISETERQALRAGTLWIDGDVFHGNPVLLSSF